MSGVGNRNSSGESVGKYKKKGRPKNLDGPILLLHPDGYTQFI